MVSPPLDGRRLVVGPAALLRLSLVVSAPRLSVLSSYCWAAAVTSPCCGRRR
jgi:hypothetical protein